MKSAAAEQKQLDDLARADAWNWADINQIKLVGSRFDVRGHDHQIEVMTGYSKDYPFNDKFQVNMKSTQMVFTESYVLWSLHKLIHNVFPLGIIYFFPTRDDVTDFSDSRFKPLIDDNPTTIGKYVKDTNRATLKRIGKAYLYFRGARLSQMIEDEQKTSSKIKGTPADACIFDELDEMDQDAIPLARGRMEHSNFKYELYLANPTMPNYGIHKYYMKSDQRVWMIKCRSCGEWTSCDLEFPGCLERVKDGHGWKVIRVCKKCRREIYSSDGQWIPQFPDRSMEICGRWIGKPSSSRADLTKLLDEWESPDLNKKMFYNLQLGLPYINTENRLNTNDVYDCCGEDPIMGAHPGPCAMGVDVQGERKGNRVLIACKPNNTTVKIVFMGRISSFEDIRTVAGKLNVQCAVFDIEPETRQVKQFIQSVRYPVYMCKYQESQHNDPAFDSKDHRVTFNRTEICDATHDLVNPVHTARRLVIPRRCEEVEIFAKELCAIAKTLSENKDTGSREYSYRKLDSDDYRHALNYLNLALMKVGVSKPERKKMGIVKDVWGKAFKGEPRSAGWMGA